jgi:hypothetical protein
MDKVSVITDLAHQRRIMELCTDMTSQEVGSWYDYSCFYETPQQTVFISRYLTGFLITAEWDNNFYMANTLEQVRETLDMFILNWEVEADRRELESQNYWLERQDLAA